MIIVYCELRFEIRLQFKSRVLLFEERLEGSFIALVGGTQLIDVHPYSVGRFDHTACACRRTLNHQIVVSQLTLPIVQANCPYIESND